MHHPDALAVSRHLSTTEREAVAIVLAIEHPDLFLELVDQAAA